LLIVDDLGKKWFKVVDVARVLEYPYSRQTIYENCKKRA